MNHIIINHIMVYGLQLLISITLRALLH